MADPEPLQMIAELRTFVNSEPWDLSFLDDQSPAGRSFGASTMNYVQPNVDRLSAPSEKVPQFPKPLSLKRKRRTCRNGPLVNFPELY